MALNSDATILPGRGTVFLADRDTAAPDYKTVDPTKPDTFTGWECLGHTSRENQVSLSKDGGDATQLGSWWDAAIRESREASTWSWTVNSLQVDKTTLKIAWPNGEVRDGAFWVPGADTTASKAAFILMVDGDTRAGIYLPNTPMSIGDAPEIDLENFFEIQLSGSILSSPTTGDRIGIYHPSFDAVSPVVGG